MNYSHRYHAGSFADVVKHVILAKLLEHFLKKEAPFCYIDTHAGAGIYDLQSVEANKTVEYESGIARLFAEEKKLSDNLQPYIEIIKNFQSEKSQRLTRYPGSPWIAEHFLRPQDAMILNEKHPDTATALKASFRYHEQVSIHERDAYELLPAILPLKEIKRALILIDPPFEKKTEMKDIITALEKSLPRFPQAMYLIWVPITDKKARFVIPNDLRALLPEDKHLFIEFWLKNFLI
jgi:23S rRNA (adenine2030-N6)-methyltransferase